ncbi:hypothetical protein T484DRAFT_1825125, partial [Baffinella frigidus]
MRVLGPEDEGGRGGAREVLSSLLDQAEGLRGEVSGPPRDSRDLTGPPRDEKGPPLDGKGTPQDGKGPPLDGAIAQLSAALLRLAAA